MSNTVVLALLPVSLESHGAAPPLLQLGCIFSLHDRNIDSIAYHQPWMNNRARTHTGGRRDAMQWYETRDETRGALQSAESTKLIFGSRRTNV